MAEFKVHSEFTPQGDQPQAIAGLVEDCNVMTRTKLFGRNRKR
jgi:excinuclease UvrABC helicase subunit UvrB